MLRDASFWVGDESAEGSWGGNAGVCRGEGDAWRVVDQRLRGIAKRRAALDAEEAQWLREAERVQVWRPLGMVNMIDYLERVLGYAPRTAQQRMQVARALESLPAMTEALATGELPFSAVRELVRVATPSTEAAWCAHVGGMNLRQIEEAVQGHRPGDLPTDAPDPELRTHLVSLRLSGAVYALWRQAGLSLDEEQGHHLDDDELGTALATAVLERGAADAEHDGRAKYQIALTVCRRCDHARQVGAGLSVPVDAARLAQARCDAQHLGSLDGEGPERAHQDVPPSVVRFVHRRDGERCQTPGCRSALGIEIHHIVHRVDGGTHEPSNLTLRCFGCHAAHHRGVLIISGRAPDQIVTTRLHDPAELGRPPRDHAVPVGVTNVPAGAPTGAHVSAPAQPSADRFAQIALRTQARDALVTMGWKPGIAAAAVDDARANGSGTSSLEALIRKALRRCPIPRA